MLVVADASPIIALYNIGQLDLLRKVYRNIIITKEVSEEIGLILPSWVSTVNDNQSSQANFKRLKLILDPGEASSIAYCLNNKGPFTLIIDERKGRKIAKDSGLKIIGLLGVIVLASKNKVIDDGLDIIDELIANGFRVSDSILKIVRDKLAS